MKLSNTSMYAIRVAVQLAQADSDAPISADQLADAGGMPKRFLLQILRSLVTHDVLQSTRGVLGGYKLARRADKITVLDIVSAVDPPETPRRSDLHGLGNGARARLLKALQDGSQSAKAELQRVSVADLARGSGRRRRR
jgi:Rrf2 family protein